jgi:hypothetical protein
MARYLRKLLSAARAGACRLGVLLLVLLGLAAPAPARTPGSDTINERVTRIRLRLQDEQHQAIVPTTPAGDGADVDQWGNWGNWRNWGNWNNWRNWGNWANWGNF